MLEGNWIDERCPKCGCQLLGNKIGDKWCSFIECDYSEDIKPKPPLGIMPRYIWNLKRIDDLNNAINRYYESGLKIPMEWIEEYNDLIVEYNERR